MRSGLERYAYGKLGNRGSERLDLRTLTDKNVQGWLNWITRQRYGGDKVEGNADDLRKYINRTYGPQILRQMEPTINRIAPQSQSPGAGSGSAQTSAGGPQPAAAPQAGAGAAQTSARSQPAPKAATPLAAPSPGAGAGSAQTSAGGPGSQPVRSPGAGAGAAQTAAGGPGSAKPVRRKRRVVDPSDDGLSIPPIPGQMNPEVPDFLQRQRNTPAPQAAPQAAPPQATPLQAPAAPQAAPRPQPIVPSFGKRRPQPTVPRFGKQPIGADQLRAAESILYRGKLIEVGLQRSQIDQIMKKLAVVQKNAGEVDRSQPPPQAAPPQQATAPRQSQPQAAPPAPQAPKPQAPAAAAAAAAAVPAQPPPQPPSGNVDVSKLMNKNVTMQGLQSVQISKNESPPIERSIQDAGGSIPLSKLLQKLQMLSGETFSALLYAAAAS